MAKMVKDIHLTGKDLMDMVQLRPEDIGRFGLVPGPRERLDAIVKKLQDPIKNFSFMEYTMFTGTYEGTKITSINGGRFSADTAITTEILCNAKVGAMIRLGSCGALREDIKVGDLIVVDSAMIGEGVSQYYSGKNAAPTTNKELSDTLFKLAQSPMRTIHRGKCWTTDGLLRETREIIGKAVDQGAIAVDMVTSAFLTICQHYKVPAAVILAVSDNVITGEMGFMNPDYYMAEADTVKIGLNLVKELAQKPSLV